MKKILVDDAYKKLFYDRVNYNIIGLKIEFASKPPKEKASYLSNRSGLRSVLLGCSISFEGIQKITRKQLKEPKIGFCGQIAKLSQTVWNKYQTYFLR